MARFIIKSPVIKHIWLSAIFAIVILPFMSRDISDLRAKFSSGLVPLDISYYQRIFNSDRGFLLGDFYIESGSFIERTVDFYNLGELIQRLGFKLMGSNVLLTYYFFSLIYLTLWIFLITRIVTFIDSQNIFTVMLITSILLMLFFSRNALLGVTYPFARIINPQFSIVVWLFGNLLLVKILLNDSRKKEDLKPFLFYAINIVVASLSYQFVFFALMSTSVIVGLYLISKRKYNKSFWFSILIIISTVPYVLVTLEFRSHINYLDLVERMGLIISRVPGSALTLIITFLSLIVIFFNQKYFSKLSIKIVQKVLVITTLGIILASQSNIVTNMAIQFSDHFLIFAVCNLILVIIFSISKLKIFSTKYFVPKKAMALIVIILIISSMFKTFIPAVQYNHMTNLHILLGGKFDSSTNVIVDSLISSAFPVYSSADMLYQNDIYSYKYSNEEILERYYISKGCPRDLNLKSLSPLIIYRVEGYRQKAASVEKYLSLLNLEEKLSFLFRPLQIKALNRESEIKHEIENFLVESKGKSCVSLARSYDVDFILFDNTSLWNKTLNSFKTEFRSLGEYTFIDIKQLDLKK
jgi:hypothetical protein